MSLSMTLWILGAALAVTVAANLLSRRPYTPGRIWTVPYTGIQFLGLVVIFAMCAHLITLLTGEPFRGRMGP